MKYQVAASLLLASCFFTTGVTVVANSVPQASISGGPTSIGSASIIAYATRTTTGANPNGVALTLNNTNQPQYFYIRNTGNVLISGVTIGISYSAAPSRTAFLHCNQNVLFTSATTCASGSTTSIPGAGSITLSLAAGSWYAFEIDTKKTTTPTVSVSISTSQIRPAIITNS